MSNVIMPRQSHDPGRSAGGGSGSGNGYALTGFILSLCGILPFIGFIAAILAVIFSALGLKQSSVTGNGRGLAIAGLVIGIVFSAGALLIVMARLF